MLLFQACCVRGGGAAFRAHKREPSDRAAAVFRKKKVKCMNENGESSVAILLFQKLVITIRCDNVEGFAHTHQVFLRWVKVITAPAQFLTT